MPHRPPHCNKSQVGDMMWFDDSDPSDKSGQHDMTKKRKDSSSQDGGSSSCATTSSPPSCGNAPSSSRGDTSPPSRCARSPFRGDASSSSRGDAPSPSRGNASSSSCGDASSSSRGDASSSSRGDASSPSRGNASSPSRCARSPSRSNASSPSRCARSPSRGDAPSPSRGNASSSSRGDASSPSRGNASSSSRGNASSPSRGNASSSSRGNASSPSRGNASSSSRGDASSSSCGDASSSSRGNASSPSRCARSPSRGNASSPSRGNASSSSRRSSSPSTSRAVGHEKPDEHPTKNDDGSSSCCKLTDLKHLPQCNRRLGPLDVSSTHTVLVDVGSFNSGMGLKAQKGRDIWNNNFVKMPSSESSFAFVKTGFMKTPTKVKRWHEIEKHLEVLTKKKTVSVKDVEEAIIKCNPTYKDQWSFDALSSFLRHIPKEEERYFLTLFPKIAKLALKLPKYVGKAVPLLQRGMTASITLSQVQISCLLANAFFCTFPHRNTTNPKAEYHNYPSINFSSLFGKWSERKREKLRAIMHYFNVVTDESSKLEGLVTFERRCLRDTDPSTWRSCKEKMPKLHVASEGTIEAEGTGMLQVDFACNMIGGGVLASGLVQEEILFLMNPELIVSRLFTEKLDNNECLIITGSQQFSCYSGFSDTFKWVGPYEDDLPSDEWGRKQRQILAIDALPFKYSRDQYDMKNVMRELNKAYCGFKTDGKDEPDIATGKWGCGAFKGDPQLKAVIQLMAAARAGRGLAFFTFGDFLLKRDLERIHHLLLQEKTTVGKLFRLLEDYCCNQRRGSHVDLFEFIRKQYRIDSRSHL